MPSNASVVEPAESAVALRRLPVRNTEPPFDDELSADAVTGPDVVQGTLALAFALPGGLSAVPPVPGIAERDRSGRRLTLVPPLAAPPGAIDEQAANELPANEQVANELATPKHTSRKRRPSRAVELDDFGPQRTPRALLPEPKPWAARLVQAIVEVTAGARPVGQLIRWTTADVYESTQRRIAHAGSLMGTARRAAAIVRSVHVNEPKDGVAEVCAVVQQGQRCRAIALRLEGVDGRWQCTALQMC